MSLAFTPLDVDPSPEVAHYDVSEGGIVVARLILPKELEEMYRALDESGVKKIGGVEIRERAEETDTSPRMDLIRTGGLRKSGVSQKLAGVTLQNVVSTWQNLSSSPLTTERTLTLDAPTVNSDKAGKQFVNVLPIQESTEQLALDARYLQYGLCEAAGRVVFLSKIQFGITVASVDLGEGYASEAEVIAHRIANTIKPAVREAAARFAMVGYGVIPRNGG